MSLGTTSAAPLRQHRFSIAETTPAAFTPVPRYATDSPGITDRRAVVYSALRGATDVQRLLKRQIGRFEHAPACITVICADDDVITKPVVDTVFAKVTARGDFFQGTHIFVDSLSGLLQP